MLRTRSQWLIDMIVFNGWFDFIGSFAICIDPSIRNSYLVWLFIELAGENGDKVRLLHGKKSI